MEHGRRRARAPLIAQGRFATKKFDNDGVRSASCRRTYFTDSNWEIGQKAFYNRYPLLKEVSN